MHLPDTCDNRMNRSLLPLLVSCILILTIFITGCMTARQGNQPTVPAPVNGSMISITADGKTYPAYFSAPALPERHPAIVLLHSFNGLEPGYKVLCDRIAGDGFVVIAPEWQTYVQRAGDPEVEAVIRASVITLKARPEVDASKLGLTGFCAGGRYTMLFLPQVAEFKAGVAFYGFPYSRGNTNNTTPAEHIRELSDPMLIIHGSRDQASPIDGIYNYTKQLDAADRYFELKVYQGKPHGFMIANGTLVRDTAADDAYAQMIGFFKRMLE
jgi:carboxymethylenebutenolidase